MAARYFEEVVILSLTCALIAYLMHDKYMMGNWAALAVVEIGVEVLVLYG